jgi:putative sterol carrier protein
MRADHGDRTPSANAQSTPKVKPNPKAGSGGPAHSGTRTFFEGLQQRGHEPILKGESGTLRFDLSGGSQLEHWHVTISDGDVTVSHRRSRADTMLRVDRELFNRIAEGRANAMAAQLRGALAAEGDLHLLMVFQRLFPGPPGSSTRRRPATVVRSDRPNR